MNPNLNLRSQIYDKSKIITYWIRSHKLTYTCCEIRLKCRTRPRLSLLAISGVCTLRELHLETRSFERLSKSRPPCLKPEIDILRMFVNKRASDQFESNMAPTEIASDTGGTKINLSMLIDFLLQKTYHELTVLSEL